MDVYHVLNRGVEKRSLFLDDQDRRRFIHDIYEFNRSNSANNTGRKQMVDLVGRPSAKIGKAKPLLVQVHGWCLMGNHYHLLLSELVENGLSKFLMRLNVGYAKYFNERYERQGTLFQGRTKKIRTQKDAHFLYILNYIHLNPLDFLSGANSWRTGEIQDAKKALTYLDSYRWSSYLDYCGKRNFPSILSRDLFTSVFKDYPRELANFVHDMSADAFSDVAFE